MSMLDFAQHILAVTHDTKRLTTNLGLQMLMYFAFVDALKTGVASSIDIAKIYTDDADFKVSHYGPQETQVYNTYRSYFADVIRERGKRDDTRFGAYNTIIEELLETDLFSLVDESRRHPFWKKHQHAITDDINDNPRYSLYDIIEASTM